MNRSAAATNDAVELESGGNNAIATITSVATRSMHTIRTNLSGTNSYAAKEARKAGRSRSLCAAAAAKRTARPARRSSCRTGSTRATGSSSAAAAKAQPEPESSQQPTLQLPQLEAEEIQDLEAVALLEEHDDVQHVYHNLDVPAEMLEGDE